MNEQAICKSYLPRSIRPCFFLLYVCCLFKTAAKFKDYVRSNVFRALKKQLIFPEHRLHLYIYDFAIYSQVHLEQSKFS